MSILRPIRPADHADVLALNHAFVELLAPMDEAWLERNLPVMQHAAVIQHEGAFAGFVLTLAEGADYDSDNYRWFAARHQRFAYLDRVVLHPDFRRLGLGSRVYDELEAEAALDREVFALEVNIDPPNEPSLSFHRRRGFIEVGQQPAGDHLVAMMEKPLG